MPFGKPPLGGPLGKSRSRLSASGLTAFLRCKNQWFLSSKLGLSSPLNTSQVLGIVIEDALCEILMKRPKSIESLVELKEWWYSFIRYRLDRLVIYLQPFLFLFVAMYQ